MCIIYKKIGALTSKNFTFKARSWEMKSLRSLDIFDIIFIDLKVEYRYNKIVRIVTLKDYKNFYSNFITDNSRFFFDSLYFQRVNFPLLRIKSYFISISWFLLFFFFKIKVTKFNIFFNKINFYSIIGNFVDFKSLSFFKKFLNELGSNLFFNNFFFFFFEGELLDSFFERNLIKDFIFEKSIIFFIGFNSRAEFPLLYRLLKKKINSNKDFFKIFNFCNKVLDFNNLYYRNFGINFLNFFKLFFGTFKFLRFFFKFFKKSFFVFGLKFFQNFSINFYIQFKTLFFKLKIFKQNLKNFLWMKESLDYLYNIPYLSSSSKKEIGYLSNFFGKLGFLNRAIINREKKILFIIDSNEVSFENIFDFIIYQGVHMDLNFFKGNLVMPITGIFESTFFFFDFFGDFQKIEYINIENFEKKRSSHLILFSFNIFFFNFFFYKFGFFLKKNKYKEKLSTYYFKFFILKLLGVPKLKKFSWWDLLVDFSFIKLINVINFFIIKRDSLQNFKNLNNLFYSNKVFLNFFFNIYKISSYTRFSKNLIITSIKNRKFNFK